MKRDWLLIAIAVLLPVAVIGLAILSAGTPGVVEGEPKVWFCDRVLIVERAGASVPSEVLAAFLDPDANLLALGSPAEPEAVEYSCRPDAGRCDHGGKVCFTHAVEGNGWTIQWGMRYCDTGEPVESKCSEPVACGVYFTGIGCPHCAAVDPWLFYEFVPTRPVVLVEYEIYRGGVANQRVFERYVKEYGAAPGVPQVIFDQETILIGEVDILKGLNHIVPEELNGACPVEWLRDAVTEAGRVT